MKKAITLVLFILILGGITAPARIVTAQAQAPAYEDTVVDETLPLDEEAQEQKLLDEYPLPYPGILPDHPLFFLKKFRDWVLERLIMDPLRKSEFYVLQADKRLQMGVVLAEKQNTALALSVIGEEKTFMQQAFAQVEEAKSAGTEIPGHVADLLIRSTDKHVQILVGLERSLAGSDQGLVADVMAAMTTLHDQAATW